MSRISGGAGLAAGRRGAGGKTIVFGIYQRNGGVYTEIFYLHLKECELRFNYRRENLYRALLDLVRQNPLK